MNVAEELLSFDSRRPIQRLRRCELWRIASHLNVPYPPDAPKEQMIQILESHGVDVTRVPAEIMRWRDVEQRDELGRVIGSSRVPIRQQHYTAGISIDYAREIEEASTRVLVQNRSLEEENARLRKLLSKYVDIADPPPDSVKAIERMQIMKLKKYARDRGVQISNKDSRAVVLNKMRAAGVLPDGDAAAGSE